ncbi:ABC transporter permease [Limibacillus halophilus]|uniref:Putative spermidine/putrescine transport system permease protein n=1 Tax=Limibacillus halophilus TaxID=1579333 RepID=A0A839SNZ3_9PROT|nr:ABC transporter permease [Limibacillus halophilus]MBB3064617.1 putative spermidine/putrescine transport system permease protein [Limibacillus halophilus]
MADTGSSAAVMTTSDGIPLKVSLQRALRRSRRRAFFLVLPLLAFLTISFVLPIFDMLFRSVDNTIVPQNLPSVVKAIEDWDPKASELPSEAVYEAMVKDIQIGFEEKTLGSLARRLNYDLTGSASLFRKSGRRASKIEGAPYKEQLIEVDEDWGDPAIWNLIKRESDSLTASYFLSAVDMRYDEQGDIAMQPDYQQIYLKLFWRTLVMSAIITGLCILLGYPVAYLMATLPLRTSNLLMILVLLPFWTSLLVRTTAWIALLQTQGVLNDLLVAVGVLSDDGRIRMIYNQTGTIVAMTHILLPFMILPLYSVMKTIPPSYMRAARSMGANPFTAFVRVYMPNTVAGVGAGSILCFILAIGYYITPALVGGQSGTLISNFIADHISVTLNWGLAAALGVILLGLVMLLYVIYDRIVGIDNMKLG